MALRILPWAICVALIIFSVSTYAGLPEAIPTHLNAAGEVTRNVQRSWMSWMALPLVAAGVQALLSVLSVLLPKNPQLFNFPEKERFLKLPPNYRGEVIVRMQETLDIIAALTMLLMFAVQLMLWRAALGHSTEGSLPLLMIGTVVFVPLALWLTSRVSKAVEEAEKKWRAAGQPAE